MSEKTIAQHTPGPWKPMEFPGPNFTRELCVVRDVPDHEITTIASVYEDEAGDVVAANARLLAAAPRMFDALRGMVGLIQLLPDEEQRRILQRNHRYIEANEALAAASESEHA